MEQVDIRMHINVYIYIYTPIKLILICARCVV